MSERDSTLPEQNGETEIWKDIPGYEGLYQASTFGRIRSFHSSRWKLIAGGHRKKKYRTVILCKHGRRRDVKIDHLVLETFVGPKPVGNVSRHLNDVGHDNLLMNLAWGTHKQNRQDAIRNGLHPDNSGERNGMSVLSNEDVLLIRRLAEQHSDDRNLYGKYSRIAKHFHDVTKKAVSRKLVRRILANERWKHL